MDDLSRIIAEKRALAEEGHSTCEECNGCQHSNWFACSLDYVLSHPCPTCKAPAWVDCNAPAKSGAYIRRWRQHAARQRKGSAQSRQDIGKAPWPEDRDPHTSYSTIDYSGRPE